MTSTIIPMLDRIEGEGQGHPVDTITVPNNTTQTIRTLTVPAGKQWILILEKVTCRQNGDWQLSESPSGNLAASGLIAFGQTGPGHNDSIYFWPNGRNIAEGQTLTLKFSALSNRPVVNLKANLDLVEQDSDC